MYHSLSFLFLREKIISKFHDLESIAAIFLCPQEWRYSNKWVQKYSKVYLSSLDSNEFIKQVVKTLSEIAMTDEPTSNNLTMKRSNDCIDKLETEKSLIKRIKAESGIYQYVKQGT